MRILKSGSGNRAFGVYGIGVGSVEFHSGLGLRELVRMYTCIYLHITFTHLGMYIYIYMHIHIKVFTHIHMYVHIYV